MTVAVTDLKNAEVIMFGSESTGGSNAKNFANVFHFRRTTVVNPINKSNLNTIFQSKIAAKVCLALNHRYTQTYTSVRWQNDPIDQAVAFAESNVGAIAGDSMVSGTTAFMLYRTGFKGGSYMGNKKFGPISEADSTGALDDELNAGALALWATVITNLMAGLTDSDGNIWVPVVFSPTLDKLVVKPIVVSTDANSIVMRKTVGRLKRRFVKSVY